METTDLIISKESLLAVTQLAELDKDNDTTCERYAIRFGSLELVDNVQKQAANFLTRLCSMYPCDEPDECIFHLPGTSWTENEYSDAQLTALAEFAKEVSSAEILARASDVLWIRKRDPDQARAAARNYVTAGLTLLEQSIPRAGFRFRRALQLAATVDRDSGIVPRLGQQIHEAIQKKDAPDFLVAEVVDELLTHKAFDPALLLKISRDRISSATKALAKQRFCELAYRCSIRNRDEYSARQALLDLASSYEQEATATENKLVKLHHLRRALQTFRRIGTTESERDRVHKLILELESGISSEFESHEVGRLDLAENVANARDRIRNKERMSALAELVLASYFQDAKSAQERAKETIHRYPLQNMFAVERFGSTYKTATAIPAANASTGEIPGDRLLYAMITEFNYFFGIVAQGTILPMIDELSHAHHITLADISQYVYRSPHIAPGHHEFFCSGILAGIHGRFAEALHLLVPQLERLIRNILNDEGEITSSIQSDGTQREYDLKRLLEHDNITNFISEDIVLTFKILFVSQAGPNIRNELSHGMLTSGQCYSPASIYAWWSIVWFALWPVADIVRRQPENNDSSSIDDKTIDSSSK